MNYPTYATHTYRGCTITVHYDQSPQDPYKIWDQASTLVTWDRHVESGQKDFRFKQDADDFLATIGDGAVIVPVFMYEHSGCEIRPEPFGNACQVGVAYMTKETVEHEFTDDPKAAERAESLIKSEVRTWANYVTGDVFGYTVEGPDGKEVDALWGFYGTDEVKWDADREKCGYAIREAMEAADRAADAFAALERETQLAECYP